MSDRDERVQELVDEAFRRHSSQIYRYLLRRTSNHADAEDITQIVFAEAAAALSRTEQPDSLLAWLYAVAERRFIDHLRRRRRSGEVEFTPDHEPAIESLYGPAVAQALHEAVKRLPTDDQAVVGLRLFQGRSFAEIARRRGTTEAAAKMRFSRALRALRDDLRGQGLDP
jgi:RNA polymerase sigma factor (sigma-70 family)